MVYLGNMGNRTLIKKWRSQLSENEEDEFLT